MLPHSLPSQTTYYLRCCSKTLALEEPKKTYPEVEPVPGLFLRVNTISFGPADSPDICLMPLFEIDELKEYGTRKAKLKLM